MSVAQAIQAQQLHQHHLLARANVTGVGVGYKSSKGDTTGEVVVVVLVQQKKPLAALTAQDVIPTELDGMRTDVYEVGYLRAQQTQIDPKTRVRPVIPPGVSIGQYQITAGTFGALVTDTASGAKMILSNNHVLANSNGAQLGDAILQPGAIDGGQNPADMVAKLERFVKLTYTDEVVTPPPPPTPTPNPPPGGNGNNGCLMVVVSLVNALASILGSQQRVASTTAAAHAAGVVANAPTPVPTTQASTPEAQAAVPVNSVDCALGRPIDPAMFTDEILQIGKVSGTKAASLGMRVRKYGRTTQYTEGNITLLNATVNVAYDTMAGQKTARFTGQVITESMSQGGDSGSLIVDATENKAVGLLFAGSNLATIFSPIDNVLSALNVTI